MGGAIGTMTLREACRGKGKTDEAQRDGQASMGKAVPYETYKKPHGIRTGR